jgi:hypothetical protein
VLFSQYVRREHKACVEMVPNGGRVNRVFEQADVPYGPRLVPGSEACEEATKKRKSDTGARPSEKRVKVSSRKAMPTKASMALNGTSAASSKTIPAKPPIQRKCRRLAWCLEPVFP